MQRSRWDFSPSRSRSRSPERRARLIQDDGDRVRPPRHPASDKGAEGDVAERTIPSRALARVRDTNYESPALSTGSRRSERSGPGESAGSVEGRRRRRWSEVDSDEEGREKRESRITLPPPPEMPTQSAAAGAGGPDGPQGVASGVDKGRPHAGSKRKHIPLIHGCRSVDHYEPLNKVDEGSFGEVFRARDRDTGEIVALKRVKMQRSASTEGFPIVALRETNILLSMEHENIIRVREMVVGRSPDDVYMVMDFMDHDLKDVLMGMHQNFTPSEVKCLLKQLLEAVAYMHDHWYIHRDLKTSNVLLDHTARLCVCDFGLARKYGDPIRPYTRPELVITRWYRPPELLLGQTTYTTAVDMWSVGCIFAEMLTRQPLFPGKTDLDQLSLIFKALGTPTEETWPGWTSLPGAERLPFRPTAGKGLRETIGLPVHAFAGNASLSDAGLDLLRRMLTPDPTR